jgi:hypothetical protein
MTHHSPRRSHAAAWTFVTILLVVAVAGTLAVPIYARSTPAIGDFPFFYWYQLLWVPVVGILCGIAYFIVTSTESAAGGTPTPPVPGTGTDETGTTGGAL